MMMKKPYWNSGSGKKNKGFILSLDISIAAFVAFILIVVSIYYVGLASEETLSRLQLVRTGSDVTAMLDYKETLDGLDKIEIQDEMKTLLPPGYEMRININGTFPQQSLVAESTTEPPSKKFVMGGKRTFVIYNETKEYFATADFLIWLK